MIKEDMEGSIGDCLADLMHLCAQIGINWNGREANARRHFMAEVTGGEHG